MAFFSIIIPVYNVAPYLRECLDSVLAQTFTDWEAICVDDGSTDGSGAILDEYASRDSRFNVVHQANAGAAAARNAGLDAAKEDWIVFLDGDDVLRDVCLESVSRALLQHPEADAAHFGYVKFNHGDAIEWPETQRMPECHAYENETPEIFLQGEFCCKAYSKRLVGATRFTNIVRGEDMLFFARCINRANAVVDTGIVGYAYRQREGSAMHSETTLGALRGELWLIDEYRIWITSGRRYSFGRWRKLAQYLTEFYAERFFSASRAVRNAIWPEWKAALCEIKRTRQFPAYNRFVIAIFNLMPTQLSARLLFLFPQWLKRKGVHR